MNNNWSRLPGDGACGLISAEKNRDGPLLQTVLRQGTSPALIADALINVRITESG